MKTTLFPTAYFLPVFQETISQNQLGWKRPLRDHPVQIQCIKAITQNSAWTEVRGGGAPSIGADAQSRWVFPEGNGLWRGPMLDL